VRATSRITIGAPDTGPVRYRAWFARPCFLCMRVPSLGVAPLHTYIRPPLMSGNPFGRICNLIVINFRVSFFPWNCSKKTTDL